LSSESPERHRVETESPDSANDMRKLHTGHLRKSLEYIATMREQYITALDGDFEIWKEEVRRSLTVLFGRDHRYTTGFRDLAFWLTRGDCGDGIHWSRADKKIFDKDLTRSEHLLSDALEKLPKR